MSTRRFVLSCLLVFLLSQVLEIAIHGFILDADYAPYRGTLLRTGDDPWPFLFLLLAHLSFVIAFVYLVLTQTTNYILHRVERRLRAGGMVQ